MTVIQRFGSGLNLNLHFHTLLFDGVFLEGPEGAMEFRPLPPPTDDEHLARAGGSSSALRRVAGYQPRRDDQRLSAIRAPRTPRPVHSRLEPSCLPVNQHLTPLGIPLTGPFSALYLGGGPREPPLTRGGERRVPTMAVYVAYALPGPREMK